MIRIEEKYIYSGTAVPVIDGNGGDGTGVLETLMKNVVAGNNPVNTTALTSAETSIAAFLTI